ncbi:MAG: hypothetical protein OER77_07210 [Myxococcales bacterium]|nr:hypothetical protein [Myxococcales bacterium]
MKDHYVREYTERDWAKVADSDRRHWVKRFRTEGPSAMVETITPCSSTPRAKNYVWRVLLGVVGKSAGGGGLTT